MMYAFAAQFISLTLSLIISLVLPKIVSIEDYSYWQLFLFYSSYVGLFHLGFVDGIYLRLAGKKYIDLEHDLLNSQLKIFLIFQLMIAAAISVISIYNVDDKSRMYVIIMTAIYMPVTNLTYFFGYLFQTVNMTKLYSFSVIIEKVSAMVFVLMAIIMNKTAFIYYIIIFTISKFISMMYCCVKGKAIILIKSKIQKIVFRELFTNISVGINLTLANLASMFVIGIGRFIIDKRWGLKTFGKFSLSISLINFILQFIGQISMVIFPTLKDISQDKIHTVFERLQKLLSFILLGSLIMYFPIKLIMVKWLPSYVESMTYLALLMPICVFDGKMNILCTTYFKVMRKEKLLLLINILTFSLCFLLSVVGAYFINNMYFIIISLVTAIILRSVISEIILIKMMKRKWNISNLFDVLLTIVFINAAFFGNVIFGVMIYTILYLTYVWIYRKDFVNLLNTFLFT